MVRGRVKVRAGLAFAILGGKNTHFGHSCYSFLVPVSCQKVIVCQKLIEGQIQLLKGDFCLNMT